MRYSTDHKPTMCTVHIYIKIFILPYILMYTYLRTVQCTVCVLATVSCRVIEHN
jgi:hypothetical protein